MNKIIATVEADGKVSLTYPNYSVAETDDAKEALLQKAIEVNGFTEYTLIERASVPGSRVFRRAWRLIDGGISVDMEAAKNIQRDRWRAARAPLLAALDVEWQRASETEDATAKADIVARKTALRAVTDTDLSGVSTPEELAAVWPECIGVNNG